MPNKLAGVQTLDRGISLLESVSASLNGLSLGELAETLRISQPAAFNLAKTWIDRHYLEKSGRPVRYRIGPMIYELIRARATQLESRCAEQKVRDIAAEFSEANILFVERVADDFRVTLRLDANRPRLLQRPMAPMSNFYTMATGNCLFAFLDPEGQAQMERRYPFEYHGGHLWSTRMAFESEVARIVQRGYVLRENSDPFCVAAPVFDSGDSLVGAIGLSLRGQKVDPDAAQRHVSAILKASRFLCLPEKSG